MPLYEYQCAACGYSGELLTRMGENRTLCPSCGREGLKKRISGFSIGSGKPACPSGGACPPAGSGGCCGGSCSHRH